MGLRARASNGKGAGGEGGSETRKDDGERRVEEEKGTKNDDGRERERERGQIGHLIAWSLIVVLLFL